MPAPPDPNASDANADLAQGLARMAGEPAASDDAGLTSRLVQLASLTARSARTAGVRAVASGRWAADVALDMAGHLPVRDLATLQEHHHGASGPPLAERLVERAALTTAGIGAVAGGLAAVSELTPATWTTLPVELLAETLLVVAVEMKLVAELHVVAGRPITGSFADQAIAISRSWAERRGLDPTDFLSGRGADVLGRQARQQLARTLQRRLIRRSGRSVVSLAPFLAGAAAGSVLNRRATRTVGNAVRSSLQL